MSRKTLNLVVTALFILLLTSFKSSGACRLLDGEFEETWMIKGDLLLSSLQRGDVKTPGNGCGSTGNGGNPCVGSKKFASRHSGGSPPMPPTLTPSLTRAYPQHMVEFGVANDGR